MVKLYVKTVPPPDLNKNTEWFMYPGVWTTYILILFFCWLLVLSVVGCTAGMAWTAVNLFHFVGFGVNVVACVVQNRRFESGIVNTPDKSQLYRFSFQDFLTSGLTDTLAVTYYFFHWKKGTPFAEDQGIYNNLTWWEQMDDGRQLTRNRKFLIVVPVVLYLIASHTTDYRHPMLFLNTLAVAVLVIAKFPNMHKVRIFGING
ncbi:ORM1-like protein [Musa troglodytarum]|uniref:ORM1-like protein n=1 Tax=Musa troglodytarum TaxID=320322 RepID=A0A9E7LCA0_9LILI|nr:ORM1-like protein [Musa troglodytarum]